MSGWTATELDRIGTTDQVQIASTRRDGTLRPSRTIWVVRARDDIYVRAAYGPGTAWYRHAAASGRGRIRFGSDERDVTFVAADPGAETDVDGAYQTKYGSRFPTIAPSVVGEQTHGLTLRVVPA